MADLAAIKARQQQTWAQGDYLRISTALVLVSELLCEAVDLRAGQTVLEVATGSGHTALAAARRRCDVIGVDYAPSMLALGEARAAAERLPVTFREGDAEQLPFADAAFDVVLSTFGVMFAPDQTQAVRELLRVCRPRGDNRTRQLDAGKLPGRIASGHGTPSAAPTGLAVAHALGHGSRAA